MDDPVDVNKTIGFDYLDDDDGAAQTITAQGTAAETIMPVQGGNETVLQTGESSAFPVQQAPPAPKSKCHWSSLVGVAALAAVGGKFTLINKLI